MGNLHIYHGMGVPQIDEQREEKILNLGQPKLASLTIKPKLQLDFHRNRE